MKIKGQQIVKQSTRLKLNNIVGNTFERIKSVVTFQRPKSVSWLKFFLRLKSYLKLNHN